MKKYSGFTIVEMLIAMGIMTMLLLILTQVFGSIINLRQGSEATSAVAQDSRYILTRLKYDLGRSSAINSPAVGNSGSSLSLTIGGTNYTYSQSNNTLFLQVGANAPVPISSNRTQVDTLSFSRENDIGTKHVIKLNLTLSSRVLQPGTISTSRIFNTTFTTP